MNQNKKKNTNQPKKKQKHQQNNKKEYIYIFLPAASLTVLCLDSCLANRESMIV